MITYSGTPDKIEIEIYDKGAGAIRTGDGWFPVTDFAPSSKTLQFKIDTGHEVAPSDLDRQIVQRAATILSSESNWNRQDNRKCEATAKTWSIYCAMEQATAEISDGFHHRRPAMEIVRILIEKRTVGRDYGHRLMGYNNDPTTKFEDVKSAFAEALAQMLNVEI